MSKLALWFFSGAQRDLEIQTQYLKSRMYIFTNQGTILLFHCQTFIKIVKKHTCEQGLSPSIVTSSQH